MRVFQTIRTFSSSVKNSSIPQWMQQTEIQSSGTKLVKLKIDGKPISVPEGTTIYDAHIQMLQSSYRHAGASVIPTLCYHPSLKKQKGSGVCRVCLVEDTTQSKMIPSCTTPVKEGMEIETHNAKCHDSVVSVLKFILASHDLECSTCESNHRCELQDLLEKYNVSRKDLPKSVVESRKLFKEQLQDDELFHFEQWLNSQALSSTNSIKIDMDKCIRCTRCIRACQSIQGLGLLSMVARGNDTHLLFGMPTTKTAHTAETKQEAVDHEKCISCGQCSLVCPVGAITYYNHVNQVYDILMSKLSNSGQYKDKTVVVQIAPAVRVAISEEFDREPGAYPIGKLISALKSLGFDKVFDTIFSADLTIMEEGMELLERLKEGHGIPMFTSCCPAWVNLVEKYYPELIDNLSSARSPQGMLSSVIKNFWAKKNGVKPEDVIVVSIMPCTAKKDEAKRPQLNGETDFVLTTRELGKLFRMCKVKNLDNFEPMEADNPLGVGSGAGDIFGVTGGVMEAALRTAYEVALQKPLPKIEFDQVRGFEGIKTAAIPFGDTSLKVAIVHGTANAQKFVEEIKSTKEQFHFIEVMACPGGCIGGGGEPKARSGFKTQKELLEARAKAIYSIDEAKVLRKSHENLQIKQFYEESGLKQPLTENAHHYLHTHYSNKAL